MMSIAPRIVARIALPAATLALAFGVLPAASAMAATPAAPAADPVIALPLQPVVPAAQRACSAKTASGLGYTALKAGEGAKPGAADVVLVNYIGYLAANGRVFDQNMQTPFPVGNVIPGFTEGLQLMARGGIQRLCIPAALGYGAQGAGADIPPNADLVFQVELLDFKSKAEIEAMRQQAQAAQAAQGAAGQPATPAQPQN